MKKVTIISILLFCFHLGNAQNENKYWHDKERTIRYHPEGKDFVITNGNRRFTRALYGGNTAFRVEAGDLPEFALYMPGMGGNFKFGLIGKDSSKWLINADKITARYRPGSMIYDIQDKLLGKGTMHIIVCAMNNAEGMVIQVSFDNADTNTKLSWAFGGATGKKFSRDGDMGPDPESSFYLKPVYCLDNSYSIDHNNFMLRYGTGLLSEPDPYVNREPGSDTIKPKKIGKEQMLTGIFPPSSDVHIGDAYKQSSPTELFESVKNQAPAITGILPINNNQPVYFAVQKPDSLYQPGYQQLKADFLAGAFLNEKIADRIKLFTPDPYINTLGGALGIAADAIWESPSFMHGAIGWRMRLNGWRGPYAADVLGWHDRARAHFRAYAQSQVTSPEDGPVIMDTALHLARSLEKMGTSVFSSGYISRNPGGDLRPHHYDMNLVYIDELLWHFNWTGDTSFVKEMWPLIKRHLAWEKRNFDPDDDGLYDAYAAIWASDALQYSGGAVTHSSAYNYRANKMAVQLATIAGDDAMPYQKETEKILAAMNKVLWMPEKGTYAEYKDALGLKMLHPNAALWTIYHSIDSDVPDAFQSYQSLQYINDHIPHIPVKAKGLEDGYYTLSTSNWMPYDWSLNNVATAEVMHTALAYWEGGRSEEAFKLWKSELLSTMYLGGSPGNIGQISFYDAARGEAYRDFADPIGMTSRSLVQGLFGIAPDALNGKLTIKPGFPAAWNNASLETPDIKFDFKRDKLVDVYHIVPAFSKPLQLNLVLKANYNGISSITVNGKTGAWKNNDNAIGLPQIMVNCGKAKEYTVRVVWNGQALKQIKTEKYYLKGSLLKTIAADKDITGIYDPQKILPQELQNGKSPVLTIAGTTGVKTLFIQVKQGMFKYWQPLHIDIRDSIEFMPADSFSRKDDLSYKVVNNTGRMLEGMVFINSGSAATSLPLYLEPGQVLNQLNIGKGNLIPGTNDIRLSIKDEKGNVQLRHYSITNWNTGPVKANYQELDISNAFNDKVTNIFKHQYLSPRPKGPTLQLPTQGIGDWTHPLKTADINDKGLRKLAGVNDRFVLPQGIPFRTPSDSSKENICFTSQWDNFPKEKTIPLTGRSSHAYLLMAGSTNPMQTRITNGMVKFIYTDGTADSLILRNPETWWPIEQDYLDDGYAFTIDAPRPVRIHLKTGKIVSEYDGSIKDYNGKMIDGGAATVLDLPLDPQKTLKELRLKTIANDVVIGLMAVTLVR